MDILSDLVKLKNVKLVPGDNKKIISTSIFLPENPSVNFKTPMYFVEMIKLVENFSEMMGDKYILRIYYDSIFDLGIKEKPLDFIVKSDISQSNNLYNYQYNNISHDDTIQPNIKENIKYNKSFLKKIIKMVFNYFNRVKRTSDARYKNIELISYDCPDASNNPNLLGHPSTFGSIIRFFPIYDSSVESFFCINSRYPITPLMKHIIETWMNNPEKDLFAFSYQAGFMNYIIKAELYSKIKKRNMYSRYHNQDNNLKKKVTNKIDQLFVDTINSIYHLKNRIFNPAKPKTFETSVDYSGITYDASIYYRRRNNPKEKIYYKFDEPVSIAAGLFGLKKSCPYYNERGVIMTKYLQYLILSKNTFSFGIDELILKIILAFEVGSGGNHQETTSYFKYKKRTPYITLYKWDEETINYMDITNLVNKSSTFLSTQPRTILINKKKSRKNKPFRTSTKQQRKHITYQKTKKIKKMNVILEQIDGVTKNNFLGEKVIFNEDIKALKFLDSRSLFQKVNGKHLDKNDILVKKVYDSKYDFWAIFNSFSEEKKLIMVNNLTDKNIVNLFLINYKMMDYYTVVDISKYHISEINKLLDFLITYYRKEENNNHNLLKILQPSAELKNSQTNSNSNSNSSENTDKSEKGSKIIGDLKQEYL